MILPKPDHIVIVVEENHSFSEIIGSDQAPYINSLVKKGALMSRSFAVTHPSQPNYLDLFSGSDHGITDDSCPHKIAAPNLANELLATNLTFSGFCQSMPKQGYKKCTGSNGLYVRKHNPWVNFVDVPNESNLPFTSFPSNLAKLPTVSFVIPNIENDMHSGTIRQADSWLKKKINPYVLWTKKHNSLLVLTWDEGTNNDHIPTILVGPMVKPGEYNQIINHYNVLRTILDMYGLKHIGNTANAPAIFQIWN